MKLHPPSIRTTKRSWNSISVSEIPGGQVMSLIRLQMIRTKSVPVQDEEHRGPSAKAWSIKRHTMVGHCISPWPITKPLREAHSLLEALHDRANYPEHVSSEPCARGYPTTVIRKIKGILIKLYYSKMRKLIWKLCKSTILWNPDLIQLNIALSMTKVTCTFTRVIYNFLQKFWYKQQIKFKY